ncbi:hypothetical protein D031_3324A, partial [Vibrio parahaemolyticus VP-48]
MWRGFFGV